MSKRIHVIVPMEKPRPLQSSINDRDIEITYNYAFILIILALTPKAPKFSG